jgi:carboxyl-terminal processing protease
MAHEGGKPMKQLILTVILPAILAQPGNAAPARVPTRAEAEAFAQQILEATEIIRDDYVLPVTQKQAVENAIRALYEETRNQTIPAEVVRKLSSAGDPAALTALLVEVRLSLGAHPALAPPRDLRVAVGGMLTRLDPYCAYIEAEQLARFSLGGGGPRPVKVGLRLDREAGSAWPRIVTPIKGGPAHRAGLLPGDRITYIIRDTGLEDGEPRKPIETDTRTISLSQLEDLFRGERGTTVTLGIYRPSMDRTFDLTLIRQGCQEETVLGWKRNDDETWNYLLDPKHKIAYLRLTEFSEGSPEFIQQIMSNLTAQGMKGFILDLRFNPGGLLTCGIEITDLFIDDGMIVRIKPGRKREQKFTGKHEGSLLGFPMVCLVNGYSASSSEIVSAALQDHKRALIIGERSYGKGSVQNIVKFGEGEIKLTTAAFYRPNGKCLQRFIAGGDDWGVKPDRNIPLNDLERQSLQEHLTALAAIGSVRKRSEFQDRQLDAALSYLHGRVKG